MNVFFRGACYCYGSDNSDERGIMDYDKAIFALHITRLANERLNAQRPRDLDREGKIVYHIENFPEAVEGVLSEVDWTMRIIDKQGA
jgi:hypothetical protein